MLVLALSSVLAALLCLLLVVSLCAAAAVRRRRDRRRKTRLASSVRRLPLQPPRRAMALPIIHLHSNQCYGASPLLGRSEGSSQHSSPFDISPNLSYTSSSAARELRTDALVSGSELRTDALVGGSELRTDALVSGAEHQYEDILALPSKEEEEEGLSECYDRLQPKVARPSSEDSSFHDYENSTLKLLLRHRYRENSTTLLLQPASCHIPSPLPQPASPHTPAQQTRLSTASEGCYVNEFDGPPRPAVRNSELDPQPAARSSELHPQPAARSSELHPQPAVLAMHCKRHCTSSLPHLQCLTAQDYETPVQTESEGTV